MKGFLLPKRYIKPDVLQAKPDLLPHRNEENKKNVLSGSKFVSALKISLFASWLIILQVYKRERKAIGSQGVFGQSAISAEY